MDIHVTDIAHKMRKTKTLMQCALPSRFELLTPRPRQMWLGNQLRWSFCLGWNKQFYFVARYHESVSDEVQMQWALEDFRRELAAENLINQNKVERSSMENLHHKARTPVYVRMRLAWVK